MLFMIIRQFRAFVIAICLLCVGMLSLIAQQPTADEDVVYLKNGSIIRGEITERIIGESIKIQILGGSIFVFEESEIETILKAPKVYQAPVQQPYVSPKEYRRELKRTTPVTSRKRGVYNMFSYGFQPGPDTWSDVVPWPTLQWRTGYNFNQFVNLGVGFGIDAYMPGGTIPIYADFHGELGKEVKPIMFHYFFQAGYGISAWNNWNFQEVGGGPMGQFGIGWKLNTRRRIEWVFTAGYKFQAMSFIQTNGWEPFPLPEPRRRETRVFRPLTLQVAVGF